MTSGATVLATWLKQTLAGDPLFGLPGTQNAELYSALGTEDVRVVVSTDEMKAAFAALGFGRVTSRPAILCTIAGPGFGFATNALLEASHDSVAVINIVCRRREVDGRRFQLQAIDHESIAGAFSKAVLHISEPSSVVAVLEAAYEAASSGEPGPVTVLADTEMLFESVAEPVAERNRRDVDISESNPADDLVAACERINGKKALILAGAGCVAAADSLLALVERCAIPVITTTSGRGVIPESHDLCIPIDLAKPDLVNELLAAFDLVVAVGVKFTHNSSFAYQLAVAPDKLLHVDQSADVLNANYPAALAVESSAERFFAALNNAGLPRQSIDIAWLAELRTRIADSRAAYSVDPQVASEPTMSLATFFALLSDELRNDGILVTDSGAHQMYARRHFSVQNVNGLIGPINFQSMGFGIPAAIGARLAAPERVTAVLTGDGGLHMAASELARAAMLELNLIVIVFVDGYFGLIRSQQLSSSDEAVGVGLPATDYGALASAYGACWQPFDGSLAPIFEAARERRAPTLVTVPIADGADLESLRKRARLKRKAKRLVRSLLPPKG